MVEKFDIPYRTKERPIRVVLADNNSIEYGGGKIRLETQPVSFTVAGIGSGRIEVLNIIDLGEEDMLISYN